MAVITVTPTNLQEMQYAGDHERGPPASSLSFRHNPWTNSLLMEALVRA